MPPAVTVNTVDGVKYLEFKIFSQGEVSHGSESQSHHRANKLSSKLI